MHISTAGENAVSNPIIKLPDNLEGLNRAEHFPSQRHCWNTNEEIASILISFTRHPEWLSKEVKIRPKSGSMLLYSRKKVRYRRDGYCWKKRKDGKTTREDHMKLKVQGTECIYGCYVHSAILPTFHRRRYWLLQNPDIVLVHYLNVPYPDDNKLIVTTNVSMWGDKKEWTKEELISQLKPMLYIGIIVITRMEKDSSNKPELLCRVCGDKASGKHYGVSSCDGCRGFFKRSIRRNLDYVCKENNSCIVDVTRRNKCQACRFRKCLEVNMKREAVQHERVPRATTSKPKYLSQFAGSGSSGFAPYYFPIKSPFYPPFFSSASAGLTNGFPLGILPTSRSALGTTNGLGPVLGANSGAGGGSIFSPSITINDTTAAAAAAAAVAAVQHQSPFTSMLVHTKRSSSSSTVSNSSNSPTDNNGGKEITLVHTSSKSNRNNDSNSAHHPLYHHRNGIVGQAPPAGLIASEDEVSSSGGEQDQQLIHHPHLHSHNNHFKFLETLHVNTLVNESVYESAAKLLFLSVKWARSVPSFLNLPFEDQAFLLEEAWPELFILSGAQWGLSIDESVLVSGSVVPRLRHSTLHADARLLRETLERIQSIRPDHTELACLKALVLFKPEIPTLRDHIQVEILQDQTHVMLQEYCIGRTPPNKIRFGKLLLLLELIRRINGKILEELFFKQTVGDIPIERLLSDIFKS